MCVCSLWSAASLILDGLPFHASKDFNWIDAPDKAIKQSRDLKYVFVLANFRHGQYIVLRRFAPAYSTEVDAWMQERVKRVNVQKSLILKGTETY